LNKRAKPVHIVGADGQLEADFDRALNEVGGAEVRLRRKVLEFETTLHESIRLLDEAVKQLKASLRASSNGSQDVTMEQLHRITHPIHLYRLKVAQLARECPPLTMALRGIASDALGRSVTRPRQPLRTSPPGGQESKGSLKRRKGQPV
jgi:hypothetical protein